MRFTEYTYTIWIIKKVNLIKENRSATELVRLKPTTFKKEALRRCCFIRIYYFWGKLPNDVRLIT